MSIVTKIFRSVRFPVIVSNVNHIYKNGSRGKATTAPVNGLMEFFDDKKNWGATEVESGRSWRKEELRLKSNSDLHQLWYVLLKERNMLLTMEQECKDQVRLFPSPERRDKVEESMENLEEVVRERNRAYYELEVGITGEQQVETITGPFGLPEEYRLTEHSIPKETNLKWQKQREVQCNQGDVLDLLKKHKEQEYLTYKRQQRRHFNHVIGLLNRFPKMDMEALKEQYPDVDIEKAKASRKYKPPPIFN